MTSDLCLSYILIIFFGHQRKYRNFWESKESLKLNLDLAVYSFKNLKTTSTLYFSYVLVFF